MSSGSLQDAIASENKRLMRAFAVGSADGMAELYTDDAQLLPPGRDAVKGRDAIHEFWEGFVNAELAARIDLETLEVEGHGDTAIEIGQATLVTSDDQVADRGPYMIVWKREGSHWRIHRDIWNSSQGG